MNLAVTGNGEVAASCGLPHCLADFQWQEFRNVATIWTARSPVPNSLATGNFFSLN